MSRAVTKRPATEAAIAGANGVAMSAATISAAGGARAAAAAAVA